MGHRVGSPIILVVVGWSLCPGATLVVDPKGGGDFTEIQAALDAAAGGDTVVVKPGEYEIKEPLDFNRLHDPADPDSPPVKDLVVQSEGGPAESLIRLAETPTDPERAHVVIFENRETEASVLAGFTLTGGKGGGVVCRKSSNPTLADCLIEGNGVAGVVCEKSAPALNDCTIRGNPGPGVYCTDQSSPTLARCTIMENEYDGIACSHWSCPNVTQCTLEANRGGVSCFRGSSPVLTDCTIRGRRRGRGLSCSEDCFPVLTGCVIMGCSSGGVFCQDKSTVSLTRCTIAGNSGWGVDLDFGGAAILTNVTIAGNWARNVGGVHSRQGSAATLKNCIVWDNGGGSLLVRENSTLEVSYSSIEGDEVWPGAGNINADPGFRGWGDVTEVYVDPSRAEPGDGTESRPYADPAMALEFDLAFPANSPCRGSGEGGADMGSETGVCDAPGATARLVHLAPGTYSTELNLAHHVSLAGAGAQETIVEGMIGGLRTGTTVSGLTVRWGSGIEIPAGESPSVSRCAATQNMGDGGGIYCGPHSSPLIEDSTFEGNVAWVGGGVLCAEGSTPRLVDCTITGNNASGGGGVFIEGGASPTLIGCTITRNWSGGAGAVACWENASATLTGCVIAGNRSGGFSCSGDASPTLVDCTILGNAGSWPGGGAYLGAMSRAKLTNCTIAGNTNGGVYCGKDSAPTLASCTIAQNAGGGITCEENASPTLTNCILWGNVPPSVCGTLSYCLTDEDPRFVRAGSFDFDRFINVPLRQGQMEVPDFIIEAPDYRLTEGSPVIDRGTCEGVPDHDIRGNPRPSGAGCDIGAYEYVSVQEGLFIRGDANADGAYNIADVIYNLNYQFVEGPAPPCLKTADVNDDGSIQISDPIFSLNHQFMGGPDPPHPYEACGLDSTPDDLGCQEFRPCL